MDKTRFNPVKKIGGWSVERDGRCRDLEGGDTCMYMYVLMFLLIGSFSLNHKVEDITSLLPP